MRMSQIRTRPQSFISPYLFAIGGNIFFILAQLIAKMQTTLVSPMFIIYYRSLIMLIFNSLLIWRQNYITKNKLADLKQDLNITLSQILAHEQEHKIITLDIMQSRTLLLMIKRVLFACISMVLFTISLKYVQLSISSVLFETAPIFAFFIDSILNKIRILRVHFLLTLVSFVGVVVIVLGGNDRGNVKDSIVNQNDANNLAIIAQQSQSLFVYLLPLGAAFTSALSMSYLHKMKNTVHPLLTVEYLMIGALMTSGFLFNFQKPQQIIIPNPSHVFFDSILSVPFIYATVIMSLLVFGSQFCRVKALFILPASKIAPLHYVGIILSILFDIVIFSYEIKWYQYIGMILTSSGLFMKLVVQHNQIGFSHLFQRSKYTKF